MPQALRTATVAAATALASLTLALAGPQTASAQTPRLIVSVIDTIAAANAQNTPISIFLDNFSDSVAGVELWIQLDRPDVILFQTDVDTVDDTTFWNCLDGTWPACNDSEQVFDTLLYWSWACGAGETPPNCDSIQVVDPEAGFDFFTTVSYDFMAIEEDVEIVTGNFDTANTLMSGWQFVDARSLGGTGFDIKVSALANQASGPTVPGIGWPQSGGTLIRLLADVVLDDTATDRTVNMRIVSTTLDNFSFSDEDGNSIGILTDSVLDTTYWSCVDEDPITFECLQYVQVPTPPYDSLSTRWIKFGALDTNEVILFDGSLTVLPPPDCICGNANDDINPNTQQPRVNIGDATYLVALIFSGGPPPMCNGVPDNWTGDPDGNCKVNIGDVTYLIQWIFNGGPGPNGCCATGP